MNRYILFFSIIFLVPFSLLHSQGYILAVGGGREDYNDWSDAPYRWMVEKAEFGKIINIDVDATSNWYPAYFIHLGAAAESRALQIPNVEIANSDAIYQELKSARGIFIEGGNQWDYVSTWKGTRVQQAIREIFQQGGVIGGTSAGLAILGDVVFDAKYGSALPEKAVYDAYIPQIHFEKDFLNLLPNILTDSHFTMRGRLGRLVPMLARLHVENSGENFIGLGIDENTAICIDPNLVGHVFGEASVTVLYKTENSVIKCLPGRMPLFTDIGYDQLIEGCVYDLRNKTLLEPGPFLEHSSQVPDTPQFQETSLNGSDESTAEKGTVVIENLFSSKTAAFYGQLTQRQGQNLLPNSVIMPRLWSDRNYFENRLAGAQWGVATHPHFAAILIDDFNQIQINQNGILTTNYIVHILDGYGMIYSGINSRGCQIPAIIGARLHFLNKNKSYDLEKHCLVKTSVENHKVICPENFEITPNFPQPFSMNTRFIIKLSAPEKISIKIFNQLGQLITELAKDQLCSAGEYTYQWDGKNSQGSKVGNGMFFAKIQIGRTTQKMKLLKIK